MFDQAIKTEEIIKVKIVNEKKTALKWGIVFLISSLVDILLLAIIIVLMLPSWLIIPIAVIEIFKRMYSTLYGWDCTEYNIGYSGIWFLIGLFTPGISLIFASRQFLLKPKYRA